MGDCAQKVVVVGAGIIGAVAAFHLAEQGAEVLVVDAGGVNATQTSFGWINASFYQNPQYFALRAEGIAAYRRLEERVETGVSWSGGLCWEFEGAAFDTQMQDLSRAGYACEVMERDAIARLEPDLGVVPDRAILFANEAAVDASALASRLLSHRNIQVARGFAVRGFVTRDGKVCGVHTLDGTFEGDQVLVAAGVGTQSLLADFGFDLPLLHRPALVVRTEPVDVRLSHVLATDFGEVRQLGNGALLTPAAIGHQSDVSEALPDEPEVVAARTIERLSALFGKRRIVLSEMQLAHRPVPRDGFPAVGAVWPGLYAAVMHSGVTLAAIMGELIAQEMLGGETSETTGWLSPFRPERFAQKTAAS